MTRWGLHAVLRAALVLVLALPALVWAQAPDTDEPVSPEELRSAMKQHYRNGLRAHLALSDKQMDQVMPRVEKIEESRRKAREERAQVTRELRGGLDGGADDAALRDLLTRLDSIERKEQELERTLRREIDELLTARQSVQFRFFTQRYRREMQQELRRLRGQPGPRGSRGRPRGHRP